MLPNAGRRFKVPLSLWTAPLSQSVTCARKVCSGADLRVLRVIGIAMLNHRRVEVLGRLGIVPCGQVAVKKLPGSPCRSKD